MIWSRIIQIKHFICNMKKNTQYKVLKDIQIVGGNTIKKGTAIQRTSGLYYMEGYLLPNDYQEDFDNLIEYEEVNGWNYIVPVREVEAFKTKKNN